ncbi:hypothetical protein [Nonomuraea sp. NPDC005650]
MIYTTQGLMTPADLADLRDGRTTTESLFDAPTGLYDEYEIF